MQLRFDLILDHMTIDRRAFVKSILITAIGAAPAHAAIRTGSLPALDAFPDADTFLENGGQQLRFSSVGTALSFQNFLRIDNQWKPSTLPAIPLLSGPSFPLMTSQVHRDGSGARLPRDRHRQRIGQQSPKVCVEG